ncbi:hypothetical protein KXQ82_09865 [Mucilaginibacter sp. HMF5004]|uniref:hypothetical protein n=1 Tax=Mucilaginibacter rivuli TaxID=2857527 RepID=UPI001C5D1C46|nr:hypothetical protein [Mucilaginibacter rivuli]MBW4890024.1 hypothetical protein [Mucilaginibacter rivuli]
MDLKAEKVLKLNFKNTSKNTLHIVLEPGAYVESVPVNETLTITINTNSSENLVDLYDVEYGDQLLTIFFEYPFKIGSCNVTIEMKNEVIYKYDLPGKDS